MKIATLLVVALLPLMSSIVRLDAAHPQLSFLLPAWLARFGATAIVALLLGVALVEVAKRTPLAPTYRAGVVFGCAALLGSVLGFDPLPGIVAGVAFISVPLWGNALLRIAASEPGAWRPYLVVLLWSGIATCAIALVAVAARTPPELYAFAHGRAIGVFENPNELALYALAIAAAGIGAALGDRRLRALGIAALCVATVTLAATGSRAGEAAYAIGAIVMLASLRPRRSVVWLTLLVAVVGIGLAFGLDRRHNPAENDSRLAAWRAGVRTVATFPLTGTGVGAYYRTYPFLRPPDAPGPSDPIAFDPHDFYLSVAAETGLLGLGTMLLAALTFARDVRSALVSAAQPARRIAAALLAGLVAVACHMVFNGFALCIPIWAVLGALAVAVPRSGYGRVP
ncbi:MAG: O-antigen ligase family protein [Candidatus Eremiobacteraeota bacterium]|nr:O-antigen ligase family protein [Candidatus Eremiobacteraeota bacterium]